MFQKAHKMLLAPCKCWNDDSDGNASVAERAAITLEMVRGLLPSERADVNQMGIIATEKSFSFCLKNFPSLP